MDQIRADHPFLRTVAEGIPILADLNRGDVLLLECLPGKKLRIVAQAQPHSVPPIYPHSIVGQEPRIRNLPAVTKVLSGREVAQGPRQMLAHRSHVVQRAYAVRDQEHLIGVLTIEKSLVEHERHATRRAPFQRAVEDLREMVLHGETRGLAELSPFQEADGIMLVNERGTITYVSGLASYHYRRIGYSEELIGQQVAQLETADDSLVERAFQGKHPFEDERNEEERLWIRKLIPLKGPRYRVIHKNTLVSPFSLGARDYRSVLITIHDATAARRKVQEQVVRQAMVQEIHHRVKNNLQTVASLLRIQARRAQHEETRQVLSESINRILSIAVVHEFLSQHEKAINLRDVAGRIAQQVQDSVFDEAQDIRLQVDGDMVFLHPHQTTMMALVINELILNALEHGFDETASGEIVISFTDEGDQVRLVVRDTGSGLPEDFAIDQAGSLGLRIVRTIVEQDLRGRFDLERVEGGTAATVVFSKVPPETFG